MSSLFAITALGLMAATDAAFAQSVQPDGQSATTTSTNATGAITVNIAPANSKGLSHNTYTEFSVPKAGVNLNNSSASAKTILNEVTSAKRSTIEGQVAVVGSKANVIIANPNGITVNGGKFTNTGAVGLITGRANIIDGTPRFNVQGGDITIGEGGLSGKLSKLDLIAKTIRVSAGSINVTKPDDSGADIFITSGEATVTAQPGANPDNPGSWLTTTAQKKEGLEASIVISSGATLSGGSITLTANDKGAGVHIDSASLAMAGDFLISTDGKIKIDDSTVRSTGNLSLAGADVAVVGISKQSDLQSTDFGILVDATGTITVDGAKLSGKIKSTFGFSAIGAVSLIGKNGIVLSQTHQKNTFVSSQDGLSLETDGDLIDQGTTYSSASTFLMSSKNKLQVAASIIDATGLITFFSESSAALSGIQATSEDSISIEAHELQVLSTTAVRSELKAETGGVLLKTQANITVEGSLIEGAKPLEGVTDSEGGVTVVTNGLLVVTTNREDQIGSLFSTDSPLVVKAKKGIISRSGRLLSNNSVTLETDGTFTNTTHVTGGQRYHSKAKSGLQFGRSRSGQNFGTYKAGKEIGTVTALDGVTIAAQRVDNIGGEITAGENLTINATHVRNEKMRFGAAVLEQNCFFLFCKYSGSSNVTTDGGALSSSAFVSINASRTYINLGGSIVGNSGIEISSPSIIFKSVLIPITYRRPGGMISMFTGHWERIINNFNGGTIIVREGDLEFESNAAVVLEGTTVSTPQTPIAENGLRVLNQPPGLAQSNNLQIGFLRHILP